MKGIYLEKNKSIEHFIGSYKEDDFFVIDGNTDIAESAFAYSDVEKILFKGCPPNIGKKAFEGCESLTTVIFGELGKDEVIEKSTLKNLTLASAENGFVIHANTFKDCGKLTTLVLPKLPICKPLIIEEGAFCGCESLRTVVTLCDYIKFDGNPFAELGERLTFVCKREFAVEKFAIDNDYRRVCVG